MRLQVLIVMLVFCCGAGCSDTLDGSEYFPTSETAKWVYDMRIIDHSHNEHAREGTIVIQTDGPEELDGNSYYRQVIDLEVSRPHGTRTTIRYVRIDEDGVYARGGNVLHFMQYSTDDNSALPDTTVLPFPPEIGRTWTSVPLPSAFSDDRWKSEIRAIESLRTNDQTYTEVLKVAMVRDDDPAPPTCHLWYAPGVGLVKAEAITHGEGSMELTLRKYTSR